MEYLSENIVRKLIEINMERMHGYRMAAHYIKHAERKKLLIFLSAQSEGFLMELEYFLKLYGGSIGTAASQPIDGNKHRFDACPSDEAILLIILQQEAKVRGVYKDLLSKGYDLDNTLFEKIRNQKEDLIEIEVKLNDLKD